MKRLDPTGVERELSILEAEFRGALRCLGSSEAETLDYLRQLSERVDHLRKEWEAAIQK